MGDSGGDGGVGIVDVDDFFMFYCVIFMLFHTPVDIRFYDDYLMIDNGMAFMGYIYRRASILG